MKLSQVSGEKNWRATENKTAGCVRKKNPPHSVQIPNAFVMMREKGAALGLLLFLCGPNCLNDDGNWPTHVMRRAKRRRNFGAPSSCRFICRPPKGRAAHSWVGSCEKSWECASPRKSIHLRRSGGKNVTSPRRYQCGLSAL
jgi:hypothetical protein